MELVLVVARARNGVIGNAGALPWHLPADLRHFKRLTVGKPAKQGDPTTVLAAGNGYDEVVRLDGKWLFKSRNITAPND